MYILKQYYKNECKYEYINAWRCNGNELFNESNKEYMACEMGCLLAWTVMYGISLIYTYHHFQRMYGQKKSLITLTIL